jgi:hypothetical protein
MMFLAELDSSGDTQPIILLSFSTVSNMIDIHKVINRFLPGINENTVYIWNEVFFFILFVRFDHYRIIL